MPLLYVSTQRGLMGALVAKGDWAAFTICALLLGLGVWTGVQVAVRTLHNSQGAGAMVIVALALCFVFVVYLFVGLIKVAKLRAPTQSSMVRKLRRPMAGPEDGGVAGTDQLLTAMQLARGCAAG